METEDDVEVAARFWAGFDLDGRRAELDARALDVGLGVPKRELCGRDYGVKATFRAYVGRRRT